MKHRTPKVLYFSLIQSHISDFWEWVDDEGCRYFKNNIFCREGDVNGFIHAADLPLFLNQYDGNLQSLHVIIDFGSIKEDVGIIRDTIVEYPEVQFLFDKYYAGNISVSSFLFPEGEFHRYTRSMKIETRELIKKQKDDIVKNVDFSLLELYLNPDDTIDPNVIFLRIINGYDNTFDASNLRYAIKYWKSLHLKVHKSRNFQKMQDSRFHNLAISVEEESKQNIFNSYSLYANGYRVLPITTKEELELVNSESFELPQNGIIIRDFDLQFEDEDQKSIDAIRGYRLCDEADFEEGSFFRGKVEEEDIHNYKIGWNEFPYNAKQNIIWNRLLDKQYPIYFITKGPRNSKLIHPNKSKNAYISDDRQTLYLPGFAKPVCGLYSPFQLLPEVNFTYKGTRYSISDSDYEFRTSRENHDHSTPLDVYDMANRMIRRAELYYNNKKYLLAALVSGEAMEILNGFHHRLMIKAYYIQAVAENAISMDVVGANEKYMAKDAQFRVEKIKEDVKRFYYGFEEISSRNVLNHIFSTCRQFCKDHEHFESEEVFLSAMGHLLEGLPITKLFKRIFKRS